MSQIAYSSEILPCHFHPKEFSAKGIIHITMLIILRRFTFPVVEDRGSPKVPWYFRHINGPMEESLRKVLKF